MFHTLVLMACTILVVIGRSTSLGEGDECRTFEGFQGQCVNITTCPHLNMLYQDLLSNTSHTGAVQILRKNVCSNSGGRIFVCCKQTNEVVPKVEVPECGKTTLLQKIVDGEDAQLFEWPWMALIKTKSPTGIDFTCGGSLISDRYVLSAAHCTNKNPANKNKDILFVRVGEYDLSQNPDCKGNTCAARPRDAAVERIIVHPEYYTDTLNCRYCHDIALIKLADPITPNILGSFPICLPTHFELQLKMKPSDLQTSNRLASIAGWGSINKDPSNFKRPDILQKAEMPIELTGFCRDRLRSYQDPSSVFCAGDIGRNSPDNCRGDSGGPIMMKGKNGNNQTVWYVIGISSRGPTVCGAPGGQRMFTNLSYYLDWIQENSTE